MAIISAKNLVFSYSEDDDTPQALSDLSLDILPGEFVAVLGHNGSGKSTFAKTLNAILLPSGGSVYIDGIPTSDQNRLFDIRSRAGMVFQNPDNQIVANVVEEDVAFACENMGIAPSEIRRRVDDALAAVGMTKHARHAPHLLSGGQKQRVAIAGVLAMMPKIIVLDEPTAMLDPSGRQEVMSAIVRLNKEHGITIVLITHHMDEATYADRVVVMSEGTVVMDDKPERIFAQVERMYDLSLSVPQTVQLMHLLDGCDLQAMTVEQCADEIMKYLGEKL